MPLNLILYGPPGTGKTYRLLQELVPLFTDEAPPTDRATLIAEAIVSLPWWQVIAAVLAESRDGQTVPEIKQHEFIQAKAAASSARNIGAMLWSNLQSHTIQESKTVAVGLKIEPAVFDKTRDSKWFLAPGWEQLVPEVIEALERVKGSRGGIRPQ